MNSRYQILDWDSEFFGFKVARVLHLKDQDELVSILSELRGLKVKVVYFFIEPSSTEENKIVRDSGALLVDEKVTYSIDTQRISPLFSERIVEYTSSEVSEELVRIAYQIGEYSRFRVDNKFSENAYKALYRQWVSNAVARRYDDVLYVYKKSSAILGLVSLKDLPHKGSISLIGVDSSARGMSIGTELIGKAIWHYQNSEIFDLDVVTQKANRPACHFYEKNGFIISNVKNIYHLWL